MPRSLVFVAGAFPRSSVPAHGAYRKDRYRAADHPDQDASGTIAGPPQHAQAHEQRHHDEYYDGQQHGGCELSVGHSSMNEGVIVLVEQNPYVALLAVVFLR
jgi:hypothetical protein